MDKNELIKTIEMVSARLAVINTLEFSDDIRQELKIEDYAGQLKLAKKALEEYMGQHNHAEAFANNDDPLIVKEYQNQLEIAEEKKLNFIGEEEELKKLDEDVMSLVKSKFGENSKEYSEINIDFESE